MVREGGVVVPLAGPVVVNKWCHGLPGCHGLFYDTDRCCQMVNMCKQRNLPHSFFVGGEGRVCDK